MTDREKVIKRLEEISDYFFSVYHHSKDREEINEAKDRCDAVEDALALLKEQEAVEPILKREGRNKYYNYYVCPCCDEEVVYDQNYCSECGAKFMWEGR